MESRSCEVCMESYKSSGGLVEVRCDYCEFSGCRGCYERYIRESMDYGRCMSCRRKWSRGEMSKKFTKKYMEKEYKRHMEEIVYQVEIQLLRETQREIEIEKKIEELEELRKEYEKEIGKISEEILKLRVGREKERVVYTRKCPGVECRGYLKENMKCGICETEVCKSCNEIKVLGHECEDSNVETVRMLSKDTKPCPGCGEYIQKLVGCDQMFCVKCKTAFSWRTMKIERGAIHNPHYFEYLRNEGNVERDPREIQCGRELDEMMVQRVIRRERNSQTMTIICQRIIHMREVDLEKYMRRRDNRDLRRKYLKKEIDEKKFKSLIQQRKKRSDWNEEIGGIIGMFITSMTDIIYRYLEGGEMVDYYKEMEELREYTNECMERVDRVYNYKGKRIENDYFL